MLELIGFAHSPCGIRPGVELGATVRQTATETGQDALLERVA